MPVMLNATALRETANDGRGVVLVIEDLSELLTPSARLPGVK